MRVKDREREREGRREGGREGGKESIGELTRYPSIATPSLLDHALG